MMSKKKAIITGITGQDGAYLARFLLNKNYIVYGAYRRTSSLDFWRLNELSILTHDCLKLVELDLMDQGNCFSLISFVKPDEIYNLAAQSFVGVSFVQPVSTMLTTGLGAVNLLEAVRLISPSTKFYQASTSEMFGKVTDIPQNEYSIFYPRSPYGVAKLYAHWMTINYRESYDIFGVCGILFNHESPLRGKEFVTRKITDSVAKIKLGIQDFLELGNLDARRDWGFAGDYVEAMYLMMQYEVPETFIVSTNRTETVRTFVQMAFKFVDIDVIWSGDGINEIGLCNSTNKVLVKISKDLYRPCEVDLLIGDYSKAERFLGWSPKISLEFLCEMMVLQDLRRNTISKAF
jgi:GDPmannose 4,6-dehydratase